MATKKKTTKAKAKAKAKPATAKGKPAKAARAAKPAKPAKKKVSFVMPGYHTVTAGLNLADARAVMAFCKSVLGGKVSLEMAGPDGKIVHALITVGDSTIMVADAVRDPVRTAALCVYVPNVDKTYAKALAAGATAGMPPTNMPWGDRTSRVVDGQGNTWVLSTHIEDVTTAQIKKRMAAMMPPPAPSTAAADQPN